jgi:hypothetical protein
MRLPCVLSDRYPYLGGAGDAFQEMLHSGDVHDHVLGVDKADLPVRVPADPQAPAPARTVTMVARVGGWR